MHNEKMGKILGIIFGGFWCGIIHIHNKKIDHDALKIKEK
jgi:hypothetical protein